MCQPLDLVLLVPALELYDLVAVVLHGEDVPLVPDSRVLVDTDLQNQLINYLVYQSINLQHNH